VSPATRRLHRLGEPLLPLDFSAEF